MYDIIEDENFLDLQQKEYLEKLFIESEGNDIKFPFYLQQNSCSNDGKSYLSHALIRRYENRKGNKEKINSPYCDFFISILDSFLKKNSKKLNLTNNTNIEIIRCSVNLIYAQKDNMGIIHRDHHDINYQQLIVYLNDCDISAKTLIYENDKKTLKKEIEPKKYKGVFFDDYPHAAIYPSYGYRIICVFTFKIT